MAWEIISQKAHFERPFLSLYEELISTPSRPDGIVWYVARRPQAVVIAPRTSQGDFLLIRQERFAIKREIWEFPAGQIDVNGSSDTEAAILQTAHRELGEETGMETTHPLVPLGQLYTSPGFTSELCHLFLAEAVQPRVGGSALEATEIILECRAFSYSELSQMVASGKIADANTLAIFARLTARGFSF